MVLKSPFLNDVDKSSLQQEERNGVESLLDFGTMYRHEIDSWTRALIGIYSFNP